MMAVSLPTGGPKSFNSNMEIANDLCIFRAEDYPQCMSKEYMEKIRKTMMKHEALFQEQVQALHKLYSIQISAMQEIRQRIDSRTQVWTYNSNNVAVHDCQFHSAVGEGNCLRLFCNSTQAFGKGSHILSSHPICAVNEFTGNGPNTLSWMNTTEVKNFPTGETKPRLEIDLDRPPENYLEESETKAEVNSYTMNGSNTNLLEGTQNTIKVSFMENNLSVFRTDSSSLKWRDTDEDLRTLPEPIQKMHQDCVKAPESKVHGIDMNKNSSGFYSRHEGFQNLHHDFPCNDLPAIGNPSLSEESILPSNHQAEKPVGLHQESLAITDQKSSSIHSSVSPGPREHFEKILEQAKRCIDLHSPLTDQPTESNNKVIASDLKKDEEKLQNSSTDEKSLPTHLITCHEASSMSKSVQCDPKDLNNLWIARLTSFETDSVTEKQNSCSWVLISERSEDDSGNNPNCSGNGSNSAHSDGVNICNDGNLSTLTIKRNPKLGGECGEPLHMSKVKIEGAQSELQETARLGNNSIETSLSSYIPDFEANHMATAESHGEPVVTGINNEPMNESAIEEACKNVAAKILLSFACCKSWGDENSEVHVKAETTKSNLDETGSDKKQNAKSMCGKSHKL